MDNQRIAELETARTWRKYWLRIATKNKNIGMRAFAWEKVHEYSAKVSSVAWKIRKGW